MARGICMNGVAGPVGLEKTTSVKVKRDAPKTWAEYRPIEPSYRIAEIFRPHHSAGERRADW